MTKKYSTNVKSSLTFDEYFALDAKYNLTDAHMHQEPSLLERQSIHQRMPEFFYEAQQRGQKSTDVGAFNAFMQMAGQYAAIHSGWFVNTYAASVSTLIVAECLAGRFSSGMVVQPTFDNIPDLLGKRVKIRPLNLPLSGLAKLESNLITNAITDKDEFVFLVLPNNPTGHYLDEYGLESVARECARRSITLVVDACFRHFDTRVSYDYFDIFQTSDVSYIVIEDTGKFFPTADLKLSFIVASEDWQGTIESERNDVLLNVSPFINVLMENYCKVALSNRQQLIASVDKNRQALAELINFFPTLTKCIDDSAVSVELLRIMDKDVESLIKALKQNNVNVLHGRAFFWDSPHLGADYIRIALARSPNIFQNAMLAIRQTLEQL